MAKIRLFVYGTLREGFGLHRMLDGCPFLEDGFLKGFYLPPGSITTRITDNQNSEVYGEIYEVEERSRQMREIDAVEGGYIRTHVPDQLGGVYIYIARNWDEEGFLGRRYRYQKIRFDAIPKPKKQDAPNGKWIFRDVTREQRIIEIEESDEPDPMSIFKWYQSNRGWGD